jgi:chaperonin GroEL (HSP60 family)
MPYLDLLSNSDIDNEKCADGSGYNLKTKDIVNMVDNYLVDPAIVVREAVINSHSVVSKLITTQLALVYKDREWNF